MPSTLDKTIGGSASNTYVDTVDGDAYFDNRLDAAKWNGAVAADKQRALLMAAKLLQLENWLGEKVATTQALAWPRIGVPKLDGISFGYSDSAYGYGYGYGYGSYYAGEIYLTTEIPQQVKDAQCELALDLLSGQTTVGGAPQIESFSLDNLSVKLSSAGSGSQDSKATLMIATLVRGNEIVRG